MAKKNFGGVENFSVLIPYKDLEILLETANEIKIFQQRLTRLENQLLALRMMYCEALEKIAQIDRYL